MYVVKIIIIIQRTRIDRRNGDDGVVSAPESVYTIHNNKKTVTIIHQSSTLS